MKVILIIVMLICQIGLFGQSEVVVYLNNGETINARFDIKNLGKKGNNILRLKNNQEVRLDEINYIKTKEKRYILVPIANIDGYVNRDESHDHLLMQVLVMGDANLLLSSDKGLFLQHEDRTSYLENPTLTNSKNRNFLIPLWNVVKECNLMKYEDISDLKYNQHQIKNLLLKYNQNCGNQEYQQSGGGQFFTGLSVHYDFANYNVDQNIGRLLILGEVTPTAYGGGISGGYRFNKFQTSFSIVGRLLMNKVSLKHNRIEENVTIVGFTQYSSNVDITRISPSIQFNVSRLLNNNLKNQINLGFGFRLNQILNLQGESSSSVIDPHIPGFDKNWTFNEDAFNKRTFDWFGEISLTLNKLELLFSYNRGVSGLFNTDKESFQHFRFGIGYYVFN